MNIEELVGFEFRDEIKDILNVDTQPSVYEDYEDFQFFINRRLCIENKKLNFVSEAFIFKDKKFYYFDRENNSFEILEKGIEQLHLKLERYYNNNFKIINSYSSEVESLEDYLFNREIPAYFMDLWFDVQKDLARIENFLFRNSIVFKEFVRKSRKYIGDYRDEFNDIDESIQFQTSHVSTLQGRLESLHNYFDSIKNEKLNKTLLLLTFISGVFLPLNLIVGFFGMNTHGMFFDKDLFGTEKVLYLLIGVIAICLVGLPIIRWIDNIILSYFLGRYKFYRNISKRINKLEETLSRK